MKIRIFFDSICLLSMIVESKNYPEGNYNKIFKNHSNLGYFKELLISKLHYPIDYIKEKDINARLNFKARLRK